MKNEINQESNVFCFSYIPECTEKIGTSVTEGEHGDASLHCMFPLLIMFLGLLQR